MAKKALIEKQQRKPKFKVRAYTRCQRCGRPRAVFRKFMLCRVCLRELAVRKIEELVLEAVACLIHPATVLSPSAKSPSMPSSVSFFLSPSSA